MSHWRVSFMRSGLEPPLPFGKTKLVVCAESRDAARAMVPASSAFPVRASPTTEPVSFTYRCHCAKGACP